MKKFIVFAVVCAAAAGFALGVYEKSLREFAKRTMRPQPVQIAEVEQRKGLFIDKGGLWHGRRNNADGRQQDNFDKLLSLGYVTGSHAPSQKTGVTVYDPDATDEGYNLYTSAHEPVAILMDMQGNVLHKWQKNRDEVWPNLQTIDLNQARRYFRRVHLCENGDLFAIFEYTGIIKIDADSKLLWAHAGLNHHDLDIDDSGKIYVLGRYRHEEHTELFGDLPAVKPAVVAGVEVFDENITVLDPNTGKALDRISFVECFGNSPYVSLLDVATHYKDRTIPLDIFHTNTIHILDGKHAARCPAFKKGNILVSFRNLSTIAVIDPAEKKVVWALSNGWRRQHQPELLETGTMLLFDNIAGKISNPALLSSAQIFSAEVKNRSRVIEFNPLTQEILWEYAGSDANPFSSVLMGSNQRLPNGNTLITESDYGRAFEVTKDKKIVWEFNNPHTSGEDNRYVAVIPEMIRLEADFPVDNFIKTPSP